MAWQPGDPCPGCKQRPCVCVTISLPKEANDVICPFTNDGVCVGQCPSHRERYCIIGEGG